MSGTTTTDDEYDDRTLEELWRSDDWHDLRRARIESTPRARALHLLDTQWAGRDWDALDELAATIMDADLGALDTKALGTLAASPLPELRAAAAGYPGTPQTVLDTMSRNEQDPGILTALVESGRLSQDAVDEAACRQYDPDLIARMIGRVSQQAVRTLARSEAWGARLAAARSGRLDDDAIIGMAAGTDGWTPELDAAVAAELLLRMPRDPDAGVAPGMPPTRLVRRIIDDPHAADRAAWKHTGRRSTDPQADRLAIWDKLIDAADRNGCLSGIAIRLAGDDSQDVQAFLSRARERVGDTRLAHGAAQRAAARLNRMPDDMTETMWEWTDWVAAAESRLDAHGAGQADIYQVAWAMDEDRWRIGITVEYDDAATGEHALRAVITPDEEERIEQTAGGDIMQVRHELDEAKAGSAWYQAFHALRLHNPRWSGAVLDAISGDEHGGLAKRLTGLDLGAAPDTVAIRYLDIYREEQSSPLRMDVFRRIIDDTATDPATAARLVDDAVRLSLKARDGQGGHDAVPGDPRPDKAAPSPEPTASQTDTPNPSRSTSPAPAASDPTGPAPRTPRSPDRRRRVESATLQAEQLAFDFDTPAPTTNVNTKEQHIIPQAPDSGASRRVTAPAGHEDRKEQDDGQETRNPAMPVRLGGQGSALGMAQGDEPGGAGGDVRRRAGTARPVHGRDDAPVQRDGAGDPRPVGSAHRRAGAEEQRPGDVPRPRGDEIQAGGRDRVRPGGGALLLAGDDTGGLDLEEAGSPLERARANVHAIETLRDLETTGRTPGRDDLAALAAYAGWGGAADAFRDAYPDGMDAWRDLNGRLRSLLTADEYAQARSSTLTAFYTPRPVVEAIWDALAGQGFGAKGDTVLEPGCGTGNFIRATPQGSGYSFTGIEADPVSAAIAARLCPGQEIINNRMERTGIPDGSFDLAVGNVPYSDAIRIDGHAIHDWFILESVRAVRPGGLVAVLTSRYTLDKTSASVRRQLAAQADLVAACRLPRETFGRQAGTEVVSDILILRRRGPGEEPAPDTTWLETGQLDGVPANRLFLDRPGLVAGAMRTATGPYGPTIDVTCGHHDAGRLGRQIAGILARQLDAAGGRMHDRLGERTSEPAVNPDATHTVKVRHTLDSHGRVWYGDVYGTASPSHARTKGGDARIAAIIRLRDQAERLLDTERDPKADDREVQDAIGELDSAYDTFTARYGRLCDHANRRAFDPEETDPSLNIVWTLERTDSDGFKGKSDILTKRVATPAPPMPEHADTPEDALAISLDRTGRIDTGLIARLLDTDADDAARRLGDLIVTDPDTGEPTVAAAYLSGDIQGKLDHLDRLIDEAADAPERVRRDAWLRDNGLDDPDTEAGQADRRIADMLRDAGAWAAATDPMADVAVDTGAWFDHAMQQGGGVRHPFALAGMLVADARPGAIRLHAHPETGQPILAPGPLPILARAYGGSPSPANSGALFLLKAATSSGVDDRTLAAILAEPDIAATDIAAALSRITDPGLWEGDPGRRGSGRLRCRDTTRLARQLREDPAIIEYLAAADLDRLRNPVTETDQFAGREYTYTRPRDLPDCVSADGLHAWRERRESWMRGHPADRDDTRVDALRALRARLEAAMPARLGHEEISVSLGSAWVPPSVIRDFILDTFRIAGQPWQFTPGDRRSLTVSHDETTGTWQVNSSMTGKLDEEIVNRYGVGAGGGRNPFDVLQGALNNTTSKLTRPDPDDPGKRVRDEQGTAMLYAKRRDLQQTFRAWVWQDPDRTRLLEDAYNRRFNSIRPREYDGTHLTLPGMRAGISLYGHQRRAIARILGSTQGTLVAHVVGAGKTFTGIAACHEAKRLGRASKPMIVVPNHLTGQWAQDWMTLYPGSKVLAMGEKDGTGQGAARFWAKVAAGDWDAVIVRQSTFGTMHISPERRARYFEARKAEMLDSIDTARQDGNKFAARRLEKTVKDMGRTAARGVKQREKDRVRVDARLQALRGETAGAWLDFENLGVDMLLVDEAHQYKNLAIATTIDVPGVDVSAAAKCEDLLDKCEYLRETGHGGNIVFATGTPVSNSMSELYNMERYLAPGLLRAQGVDAFNSWASTYGEIVESVEVRPEGSGYQVKQRFARFHNLPELMSTFHEYADLLTADKLDLDVPECEVAPVAVPATRQQKEAVNRLVERAQRIRDGHVDPSVDNMLNVTNDGRKISLDPKLLDPDDPGTTPMEDGKVQQCARNIHDIWQRTADQNATQLVFCDSSTTAGGHWNIQSDLKRRLVELGIPDEQIRFAADEKDPERKQALFDQVNKGEVRILIGSTGTLGTGTNVQARLIAIHDLDCPWKPAELEQRQGRIRRQGNMFGHVYDYRYVTAGTFDSYMFQTVERKAKFIGQVMNSDTPAREASDVDDTVLSLAEMKALATGDPAIARRMQAENRLGELTLLRRADSAQKRGIRQRIDTTLQPTYDARVRAHQEAVDDRGAFHDAARRRETAGNDTTGLDLGHGPITDRRQAIHDLTGIARRLEGDQVTQAGTFWGMTVIIGNQSVYDTRRGLDLRRPYIGLKGRHEHWASSGMPSPDNSANDCIRQLNSLLTANQDTADNLAERAETARRQLESARRALDTPWDGQEEYDRLTQELAHMDRQIRDEHTAGTDNPDPAGATAPATEEADHGRGTDGAGEQTCAGLEAMQGPTNTPDPDPAAVIQATPAAPDIIAAM